MNALVLDKKKRSINFENKELYYNIIIKSKHNKSFDYNRKGENNKECAIQWNNNTNIDIKIKDSNELNDKIKVYLESKKSNPVYKSIDSYFKRKNGLHNILNLYLLSEDEIEVDNIDHCPQIKSKYGKHTNDLDKTNKTAINFNNNSNKEDKAHQINFCDKTNNPISLRNKDKKLTANDTLLSKKLIEKSTQSNSLSRSHINVLDLSKRTFHLEKENHLDMKEMNMIKNRTKEEFFLFNKQMNYQLGNAIPFRHKYNSISLLNETSHKINANKEDIKHSPFINSNSSNASSVFILDHNLDLKNEQIEYLRRTNYFTKLNPFQKHFQERNNKKNKKDIRSSSVLHHKEIYLNDDFTNKSQQMNHLINERKSFFIPKSTRTLYKGSLFHAKRYLKMADVCNTNKKKQIIQINNLELGETKSKFLFSTVNIKNKGPRLASRLFEYNY